MRNSKSAILVLSFGLAACAQNAKIEFPSTAELVQKKLETPVHPTGKYYVGQVQVSISDADVPAVIADMSSQHGIELKVLDRVPGRPLFLMETNSIVAMDDVVSKLKADHRVGGASKNYHIGLESLGSNGASATNDSSRAPAIAKPQVSKTVFKSNDLLLPTQWALRNQGQEAPSSLAGRAGCDISMPAASQALGSKDVVVAVIDTGVDYLHEDLAVTEVVNGETRIVPEKSNIWINPNEIPGNGVNDDANGGDGLGYIDDVYGYDFFSKDGDPMDEHGHGTHVSGVIGALRNNAKGIAGINGQVSIMSLRFLGPEGGSDFDAQLALYYLADMAKRFPDKRFVSSNSWGAAGRSSKNGDEDDFLLLAFSESEKAGILHVAAAGNAGTSNRFDAHFPSNYSNKVNHLISVAATNNLDQLASFSSYGFTNVQVAAPGVLIMSSVPPALFGHSYEAWSGTSMATPHVSGLAALVWSTEMNQTAEEVKRRVESTVDELPQLFGVVSTSGRINVARALANDVNPTSLKVYKEVAYVQESPRGSVSSSYDILTPIKHEGAKEIAVCFSRISLVESSDWMEVLGADWRVKDVVTGQYLARNWKGDKVELCTPPVKGDTIRLRLSKTSETVGLDGYETSYLKVVE